MVNQPSPRQGGVCLIPQNNAGLQPVQRIQQIEYVVKEG